MINDVAQRLRLVRGGCALGELLDRLAGIHGPRRLVEQSGPISLTGGRTSLTYVEAARLVADLSGRLADRACGGRRVVVRGTNDYGFLLTCLAVSRAGGVVVPVNSRMRAEEIEAVVADADAEVVDIVDLDTQAPGIDGLPELEDLPRPAPTAGDVAGIFYTSGTTGRPKGARLSHRALTEPAGLGVLWPARLRRDEVVISLPIAHIMGFAALLGAAGAGLPTYFIPHFSPTKVLDAIEVRRATVFIGVPAMYRMMLEAGAEGRDLRSVRMWISGADVMPPDLARRFKRMGATVTLPVLQRSLGEAVFAQGYGSVESGGAVSGKFSPPGTSLGLGDFLGVSMLGHRMRVVDEEGGDVEADEVGELLVRGPGVLHGYHGSPEATEGVLTDDGWLRTGDMARRGRFGIVRYAGRKKDVLMHGGYSVYPPEVEETFRSHRDVAEVAVVGRPDPVKGEVPVAFVRLEPGAAATPEELVAWGRERLSDYKAPTEVRVVDEFPRTGTGKIAKPELREQFER